MKLGVALPNALHGVDRRLLLDWARLADDVGFDLLATIDKPNFDSWDPLTTLAAAAAVTSRIRLATTILELPNRNEVLVAKQAAVVDRLSEGRLVLGVAIGGRRDDFDDFDARFEERGRDLAGQVDRIRSIWRDAAESDERHGVLGPPPAQTPGPPIWLGGTIDEGVRLAADVGDGFVFAGGAPPDAIAQGAARIRGLTRGRRFEVAALAYVAVGEDLAQASRQLVRYYGENLWADPRDIILHGSPQRIAEAAARYAGACVDVLVLVPQIPELDQVARLAEMQPLLASRPLDDVVEASFPASDPPPY